MFSRILHLNKRFDASKNFWMVASGWGIWLFFEALAGVAFDHLNSRHTGEFDQNFSKKSNVCVGGGGERGGRGNFGLDWCMNKVQLVISVTQVGKYLSGLEWSLSIYNLLLFG